MFSPMPSVIWQHVAHRVNRADSGFAIARALGNSAAAPDALQTCTNGGQDCYPFPSPWSGPAWVGPFFLKPMHAIGQSCAICVIRALFWFVFAQLAVESRSITTNNRGRKSSCAKPLSYWLSFQCRLPGACKTLHRAALPGLQRVQPLPILPITTRLPARLLAVWPGLLHAALTSVCHPAIDLIGRAAFAPVVSAKRSSGVFPRMTAFLHLILSVLSPCRSVAHV